jgi:plasmid maintenance system killer protein
MPALIPSRLFLKDLEQFRANAVVRKKIAKALTLLENNPLHPGLRVERIVNDPSAWSLRVNGRYRLSFDPGGYLPAGNPDWSAAVILLRILDHDDLYKSSR